MSELQQKIKQFRTFNYVFLALVILYAIFMFYQMSTGIFKMGIPQIVIPIVIVIGSGTLKKQQKEVQTEITNRQSAE